jgi:Escherichia/Staphylococcus phage prohead protease
LPYEIRVDHPGCLGFAVVKEGNGKVLGCHPTRDRAERQVAALYAQETDMPREEADNGGQVIRREFPAVLEPTGDGRTLDLRIVPYNTVARVSDGGPAYDEMWMPGSFEKQLNAANRVLVNVEHEKGFGGVVGRGAEFRDSDEGFDGSFRLLAGPDGDKALELVTDGVLTGVSLEAVALKSERTAEGVVKRVKARLLNIALCRFPAFKEAQVLAVRESAVLTADSSQMREGEPDSDDAPKSEPEPKLQPEPASSHSEIDEILERIGYEPLVSRAVVNRPWDGSASRFEDDEYQRSCLVCRPGDEPPKTRCSLPVLEPNGDLNRNGVHAAAGRLSQTGLSPELKAQAARKLVRLYRQLGEAPPPAVVAMAGR